MFLGHRSIKATFILLLPVLVLSVALVASAVDRMAGATGLSPADPAVALVPSPQGYGVISASGKQFNYGDSPFTGAITHPLNAPIVDAAPASGGGLYLVGADGGVFTLGGAPFHGSKTGSHLNAPIVAIVPYPNGYTLVASDGGTFAMGDAPWLGSRASEKLNAPIVDAAAAPGGGLYLAAADGGVFTLGGAGYHGSKAGDHLNRPIVTIVAYPNGYLLVAADGGSFAMGASPWPGSKASAKLNAPIVDAAAAQGGGLYMVAADGGLFTFGAAFYGSAVNKSNLQPGRQPISGAPGNNRTVGCPGGGSITVNSSVADQLASLLADADRSGIRLCGWGYRTTARQVELRRKNCGTSDYAIYQMRSSQCHPWTARPGQSMHERGLAIDFTSRGSTLTKGSAGFRWLSANAGRHGLRNLPAEPWHWSTAGS